VHFLFSVSLQFKVTYLTKLSLQYCINFFRDIFLSVTSVAVVNCTRLERECGNNRTWLLDKGDAAMIPLEEVEGTAGDRTHFRRE